LTDRRKYQLRVIVPVSLSMLLALAGDLTLYTVLPISYASLGLTLAMTGLLLSANRLIRLGSNSLTGLIVDRFGRRKPVLVGLALGAVSTLFYSLPGGFPIFLLGRLLWGISWSLIYIGAYSTVLDVTGKEDRGWGSGILQVFFFAGLTVNPLLGGLLHDLIGFQLTMWACSLIGAAGFFISLFALPETMPRVERIKTRVMAGDIIRLALKGLQTQLSNHQLVKANYVYGLTIFVGEGLIMSTITLFLKQQYGDALASSGSIIQIASLGGALLALRSIISAVIAPLAGSWSDGRSTRWTAVGWGTLTGTCGLVLLALAPNAWIMVLAVILLAMNAGVVATIIPAIAGDAASSQKGASLGLLTTSGDIGSSIAPLVSYALLALIPLSQVYLLSAILLATGLPLALVETRRSARLLAAQSGRD
jgi:MFS family permease